MGRRSAIFSLLFIASCGAPSVPPADPLPAKDPPPAGALLGRTGRTLGEAVVLQGIAVEKYHKGYESDQVMQIQRIDGVATQRDFRMSLHPFFQAKVLEAFQKGKTYEVRGYEEGRSLGTPEWAMKENGEIFQTSGFYFETSFVVVKCREIPPVAFGAPDFVDRFCYLDGQTATIGGRGWVTGPGWKIQAPGRETWPSSMDGKLVEVEGVVRRGPGDDFHLDDGSARLLRLEDQVGSNVELRVTAWSLNNHWWVNFRGTELYVENQDQLPGWHDDLHARQVVISGVLERATLPDLRQITLKRDRDLKDNYIVRRASWRKARIPELK
jgi:hypothetical protein